MPLYTEQEDFTKVITNKGIHLEYPNGDEKSIYMPDVNGDVEIELFKDADNNGTSDNVETVFIPLEVLREYVRLVEAKRCQK